MGDKLYPLRGKQGSPCALPIVLAITNDEVIAGTESVLAKRGRLDDSKTENSVGSGVAEAGFQPRQPQ